MKCPIDSNILQMSNRDGIEIDYCPECRGVWLDRGELDKIIERNKSQGTSASYKEPSQKHYQNDYEHDGHKHHDYKKRKKGSFLEDMFDF